MANLDAKKPQILITIHGNGPNLDHGAFIPAKLFKAKFSAFLAALIEADKSVNHKNVHDFFVSHLQIGSAEAGIMEVALPNKEVLQSSFRAFYECSSAISESNHNVAARYNGLAEKIHSIAKGADEKFSHIEIAYEGMEPILVDHVFEKQAENFLGIKEALEHAPKYFRGKSHDSFDCELKEIDYRGKIRRGILVVSGTGKQIPCAFKRRVEDSEIRKFVNTRIWASGDAIYNGESQLPVRVEIETMQKIKGDGSPSNWRGALKEFDLDSWDESDDGIREH